MGLFDRLRGRMGRTRETIAGRFEELAEGGAEVSEEFYEELTDALIIADAGVATAERVVGALRARCARERIKRAEDAKSALKGILADEMRAEPLRLVSPLVLLIVGVNGVGKTTSIGKLAARFKTVGRRVVICAGDTFRAAAAEQLAVWAERADVPIVRQSEGADPASVVYDAIQAARGRGADIVIVDTAGRLHNKAHLIEELKKIGRIVEREFPEAAVRALLVIDANTGQNGIAQARVFQGAAQMDGIILTKLDGTAKGGVALAIRSELGLPVRYVGVGEQIDDLEPFDADEYVEAIFA